MLLLIYNKVMVKQFLISVVIPSYNEMANLQKGVLDKISHFLEKKKFSYEVVIVDDGSTDGSREFVERFIKDDKKFHLIRNNHTGKAGAVTAGMLAATGDYVLFTDMDQAVPIEEIEALLPYFEEGYDVVIGSRHNRQGAPLSRQVMSRAAVILRMFLIGLPSIHDTQCGFKMFRKDAAADIFSQVKAIHHGYKKIQGSSVTAGFDMELLYVAYKQGYKIKEVPVPWLYVETRRVSPVKDSIEGVLDLLRIKRNIIRGLYSKHS